MSRIYMCNTCGYLNGTCGDEYYECLCFLPGADVQRRYQRFLGDLNKNQRRHGYEPDDFDPDAA